MHDDERWSQARYLQGLLPKFRWLATYSSGLSSKPTNCYWEGWEKEGLAVLSQWPLGIPLVQPLSRISGMDTNSRIALHVPVQLHPELIVHVVAVHFSYDRQQQCQNAAEILQFIVAHHFSYVVVAGDFNEYNDFPDPVKLFSNPMGTNSRPAQTSKCRGFIRTAQQHESLVFLDTWTSSHGPDSPGFTFSNMPSPGLVSRPDHILVSKNIRVLQMALHGNGSEYGQARRAAVHLHRARLLIKVMTASFFGYTGYSCLHDCGPHGSCRCGVCVKGGNSNTCLLPDCEECSPLKFVYFVFLMVLAAVHFMLGLLGALSILLVSARYQHNKWCLAWGCSCCLCNPDLIRSSAVRPRFILHWMGIRRIPPVYLLFLSIVGLTSCYILGMIIFENSLKTVNAILNEEFYPSDHLMLQASLLV
ncbi:hypothetical protein C0Q70_15851 [Pomacea canaliculata]|uniref:Endonuclease/exonuclease/phosphatase domain-containing protein n=2 Tax=Pomacea canaliculata TaxID=400727 RepID=A0A2T7NW10_POMCA|nr:hypothetical protein C0Q70_15851 [Pomacea canaliculata]